MKQFTTCLALVALVLLSACQKKEIKYDPSVPSDQRSTLEADIAAVDQLTISDNSEADVLGISDFGAKSLTDWLKTRTKYIVGEKFSYTAARTVIASNYSYSPSTFAQTGYIDDAFRTSAVTIMSNIGAQTYLDGKTGNKVYEMQVAGDKVKIDTARRGIFQIGEGLFDAQKLDFSALESNANRYLRIATLFHEARHDDSNGESLVFAHAKCPSDYSKPGLRNSYACENYKNGPYNVGRVVLKKMREQCPDCTSAEKDALDKQILDWKDREMSGAKQVDDKPERIDP